MSYSAYNSYNNESYHNNSNNDIDYDDNSSGSHFGYPTNNPNIEQYDPHQQRQPHQQPQHQRQQQQQPYGYPEDGNHALRQTKRHFGEHEEENNNNNNKAFNSYSSGSRNEGDNDSFHADNRKKQKTNMTANTSHTTNALTTTTTTTTTNTTEIVAEHYNKRPELGRAKREESRIILLRKFNNWLKSVLVAEYGRHQQQQHSHHHYRGGSGSGISVFDFCGGKGGDLLKWVKAKAGHLVLIDVAQQSVIQASQRFNELRSPPFSAVFMVADCFQPNILNHLPSDVPEFDLVSCQFALHYSFESEMKARAALANATQNLKIGGYFIGTIPNANLIVKRLRASSGLTFGNDIFSFTFPQKEHFPRFGCQYTFHLEDAVDCPEFLVHFPTLVSLASEYGLKLVEKTPFHEFYERCKGNVEHMMLFQNMKCLNDDGTFPPNEWEAAEIYLAFAFQKVDQGQHKHPQTQLQSRTPSQGRRGKVLESDIIIVPPPNPSAQ